MALRLSRTESTPEVAQAGRGPRPGPGDVIPVWDLETVSGETVTVPDAERLVHLQLRRFAGCPVCNLHLHQQAKRHREIAGAGIRQFVVFHSTAKELSAHQADLPFPSVPDPKRRLYRYFGVEPSWRAFRSPRSWTAIIRGLSRSVWASAARRQPSPPLHPKGGRLGLPADFLIASDGRILACKYGNHAYDQWSVDELLELREQTEGGVLMIRR
jgi:peroxiredoxin